MAISSATGSGLAGIQQGFRQVNQAAADVARLDRSTDPGADITRAAVDLLQGKVQVQASAKVIETEQRTLGALLDVRA
jgi:hypothetical protein